MNIFDLKNTRIKLLTSITIIVALSLLLTMISKHVENVFPFHKKYCGKNNELCPTNDILGVRLLHYLMTFYFMFYYFIFSTEYDLSYLIIYTALIFHWILTNDCVLSNWEMSYYDKEQELGTKPLLHPHFRVFGRDMTDYIVLIQAVLMTLSFILTIRRFKYKYYNYLFGGVIIILQAYLMLKDRVSNWFK